MYSCLQGIDYRRPHKDPANGGICSSATGKAMKQIIAISTDNIRIWSCQNYHGFKGCRGKCLRSGNMSQNSRFDAWWWPFVNLSKESIDNKKMLLDYMKSGKNGYITSLG